MIVGGSNTLLTLALMLLLARVLPLWAAYTGVFILGVAYTTVLSRSYVYRGSAGARQLAQFIGVYLVVYLVGRVVLAMVSSTLVVADWAAAVAVVLVTAPLTFVAGRRVLLPQPSRTAPSEED